MKIRNLTTKAIGFGDITVLPDKTGETPKGFGKGHPVVDYYLSRGWIEEVGAASDGAGTSGGAVNVGVGINGNGGGADTGGNGGGTGTGDNSGGAGSENKYVDRMNKDELQALATEMGLQFAETDTNKTLIEKIKAARQTGE
jgi:hypothetical protein